MDSITSIPIKRLSIGCGIIADTSRLSFAKGFRGLPFSFYPCPILDTPVRPWIASAKKKNALSDPIVDQSVVGEEFPGSKDDEDDTKDDNFLEDFDDDELLDDEDCDGNDEGFEDGYFEEEAETSFGDGDGDGGGGMSLSGSVWDKQALEIAEEVTENLVSSPGIERVVRIPEDLKCFKDRKLYVKYIADVANSDSSSEHDGVFWLISFDPAAGSCTWGLEDVRVNREKSGKGRPLNKNQKEWREHSSGFTSVGPSIF